jgi:S-formylglutathione hydrolase
MEKINEWRMHGGQQQVWRHDSSETKTPMEFALYLPPQAENDPVPLVTYLSGLTCTWANVIEKAGAQRVCAELGLAFFAPDTSPRGLDLPAEHDSYDFGSGAGFYIDATEVPWTEHYRMYSYITKELPGLLQNFPALDLSRQAITGHSMGGHGALTIALKHPDAYKSVSAFAPISSPINCPWGQKALTGYLGADQETWRAYDTCALLEDGHKGPDMLVSQGLADQFLDEQLKPELLEAAAQKAGQTLTLHRHEGYDHSYYFMASFMEEHLKWHAEHL